MCRMEDDIPGFQMGKSACTKGREDFGKLVKVGVLPTEVFARERFEQNQITEVIKSILSCDNVAYHLGETKRIVLGGRYHDVPAIMRRAFISVMWDNYTAEMEDASHVSRGEFYRMCRVLTQGDERKPTEEYGLLMDDNFSTLKRIISDSVPDEKGELFRCLDALANWLEYGCIADAPLEAYPLVASCPRHQPAFGLGTRDVSISKDVCCGPCEGMNTLFKHVEEMTKRKGADTRTMSTVHDCFEKVELYLGHRLRVVNQQRAVSKVLDDVRMRAINGEGLDEAVVTIDFKLNAEYDGESGMKWTDEPEVTDSEQKFSKQVNAWVRQDHTCTTPSELVAALVSDGGMPDTG